jgi:hypothetical protein
MSTTQRSLPLLALVFSLAVSAQPYVFEDTLLTAPDAAAGDSFGRSVGISADGQRIFAGAPLANRGGQENRGAGYVFRRDGSSWVLEAALGPTVSGLAAFGGAVGISPDGRWIVSNAGLGIEIFERHGQTWTFRQRTPVSGDGPRRVAFSAASDRFLFGWERSTTPAGWTGDVRVFRLGGSNWVQEQLLYPSGGLGLAQDFGHDVALSADGAIALIGARADAQGASATGAAYVFRRTGTTWTQVQRLRASDAAASARFGTSVALSPDGTLAAIGARGHAGAGFNSGIVYLFRLENGTFVEETSFRGATTDAEDLFGSTVRFSEDARTLLVGAVVGDTPVHTRAGKVHVFRYGGEGWEEVALLAASDGRGEDGFDRVAISATGQVAVGSYSRPMEGVGQYVGAVYLYDIGQIVVSTEPVTGPASRGLAVYPNPAFGRATVSLRMESPERVRLVVYDVLGREVRRLADGVFTGRSEGVEGLAPGVYLVVAEGEGWRESRRLTVVR